MDEDRSLDEFANRDGDDGEAGGGGIEVDDGADGEANEIGDDERDPATATSTVSTSGSDCDRCGSTVERRWLDDGEYVCSDCKQW
ncbi:hypothetical protein ACFQAS_03200 [Halopenitus salinus]|jgi:hypothetical protein|uniref:DUF7573 domain-containing protein n=1 Tax=Halopenitus salinus TaxID=1198295 RepID=A0ABD5UQN5_9EURY